MSPGPYWVEDDPMTFAYLQELHRAEALPKSKGANSRRRRYRQCRAIFSAFYARWNRMDP